ncbi:MAG: DUF3592 domain-containing protein [Phycisphaeraceae bacterium]
MVGKLVATAFLSFFLAFGAFFFTLVFSVFEDSGVEDGWVAHPCAVVDSGVDIRDEGNRPYRAWVAYTYAVEGQTYEGSTREDSGDRTSDYRDAQAILLDYPVGGQGVIRVNAADPAESALVTGRGEQTQVIFKVVVGVFMLFFLGLPFLALVRLWWPGGRADGGPRHVSRRRRDSNKGWVGLLLFAMMFGGFGAVFFFFVSVWPTVQAVRAQDWPAVSCVVERAELLAFSDSDGDTTYLPDVLYRFELDGETYRSNRYDFGVNDGRRGEAAAREIVGRYPIGGEAVCYVDPADPSRAVLSIRTWQGAWWGSIGGLFALIGMGLGVGAVRSGLGRGAAENDWRPERKRRKRDKDQSASAMPIESEAGSPTLRPRWPRTGLFAVLLFAALFWNGITSVFVRQVVSGWIRGEPDWCVSIFMVPFVVVGVGLVVAAIRQLMLIFAPTIEIELDRRSIPLGGSTELRWRPKGGRGKLTGATITLVGEESATYTRGTNTATDTKTFYEEVLVGHEVADDPYRTSMDRYSTPVGGGKVLLAVPADSMHSFNAKHNKIVWKLVVRAKVKRWPDPKDEYNLVVLPMQTNRRRQTRRSR